MPDSKFHFPPLNPAGTLLTGGSRVVHQQEIGESHVSFKDVTICNDKYKKQLLGSRRVGAPEMPTS